MSWNIPPVNPVLGSVRDPYGNALRAEMPKGYTPGERTPRYLAPGSLNIKPPQPDTLSRFDCLKQASAAVTARGDSYGTPEDNFRTTAAMWNAWLDQRVANTHRAGDRFRFDPHDVATLLALLKLARLANDPKHADSWVDLAGYAACGMETARIAIPAASAPPETPPAPHKYAKE